MATWEDVQRLIRIRFKLIYDEPTWCGLRWRLGDALVDQRVELTRTHGEPWLQVVTEVGEEVGVSLREALEGNMRTSIGAFALEQGRWMIRYQVPLAALRFDELAKWMELMARDASRQRGSLGRRPDVSALSNYAD